MNAPRSLHTPGPASSARDDPGPQRKRPFYADAADQLRRRAPPVFEAVRLVKRGVTTALRRHPVGSIAALLVVGAAVIAGWASSAPWRGLLWGAAAALAVSGALLAVAVYAQRVARRHGQLERRVRSMADQINGTTASLAVDINGVRSDLGSVRSEFADATTSARRLAHDVRAEIDSERSRISALEISLDTLRTTANDFREELAGLHEAVAGAAPNVSANTQNERAVLEGELAEADHRQELLSEELVKVEAQLGLIKDVLLRDELAR